MATRCWDSSYHNLLDLVQVVGLPSLERRRLETRLRLSYKIICYFDDIIFTRSALHSLIMYLKTLFWIALLLELKLLFLFFCYTLYLFGFCFSLCFIIFYI